MSQLNTVPEEEVMHSKEGAIKNPPLEPNLLQLFVKNGEYVYARANDIILIESNDHWIRVYLAFDDELKKTLRNDTLKNFLVTLENHSFLRIGRFCAVNTLRLSGGNCNEQTLEFDFKIKVKLQHAIPAKVFSSLGS